MTASTPTSRLSPTAGFVNAMARLAIRDLDIDCTGLDD